MEKYAIIGKTKCSKADTFVWEKELPNLEEYDGIIVNLNDIPFYYDSPTNFDASKIIIIDINLLHLRQVVLTFLRTKRDIYFILDRFRENTIYANKNNYAFLPTFWDIDIYTKQSSTSKILVDITLKEYFNYVNEWNHEIGVRELEFYHYNTVFKNKSNKNIAIKITKEDSGYVYLLPEPNDSQLTEAYDSLISKMEGFIQEEMEWMKDIQIPLNKIYYEKIEENKLKISTIEKENQKLYDKIKENEKYIWMFSQNTQKIEQGVQLILSEFDLITNLTEKGFVVDLISDELAVEITSIKGYVNAKNNKIIQMSRFLEENRKNEKILLVANTHNEILPSKRQNKTHVTDTMIKFLETIDAAMITTSTLFQLWLDVRWKNNTSRSSRTYFKF